MHPQDMTTGARTPLPRWVPGASPSPGLGPVKQNQNLTSLLASRGCSKLGCSLPQGLLGSRKVLRAGLPCPPHLASNLISILSRSIFIFSCGELVPCSFQVEENQRAIKRLSRLRSRRREEESEAAAL